MVAYQSRKFVDLKNLRLRPWFKSLYLNFPHVPPNWADKTFFTGDNLPIMRGMNSNSVYLIYLDPPFNSEVDYAAPIGSNAAGAAFKDIWTLSDVDIAWLDLIQAKHPRIHRVIQAAMTRSDKSYLIFRESLHCGVPNPRLLFCRNATLPILRFSQHSEMRIKFDKCSIRCCNVSFF